MVGTLDFIAPLSHLSLMLDAERRTQHSQAEPGNEQATDQQFRMNL
jgi:hypothetical protein